MVKKCNGITCSTRHRHTFKSRGSNDIFVAKYNASRYLLWAKVAGGAADDRAQAVTLMSDGRIAVAGQFHGTDIHFGEDGEEDEVMMSSRTALSRTIFLALYTPDGVLSTAVEAAACGIGMCDVTSIDDEIK